jgi:hypothetical protein
MDAKNLILVLGSIIAGGLAYRAYEFSGLASAIAVVLIAGWIFVNLMTADGIFNALGNLLDPFHTAVNFLLLGFLYASIQGRAFWLSVGSGVAASLLGAILSMWIYKYWNIGG